MTNIDSEYNESVEGQGVQAIANKIERMRSRGELRDSMSVSSKAATEEVRSRRPRDGNSSLARPLAQADFVVRQTVIDPDYSIDSDGYVSHPAALAPIVGDNELPARLETIGVVDGKLPSGLYSARDQKGLYTFTESAKIKQGAYRVENEGIMLEGSGLDPAVQQHRREELRKAKNKLRPFLETDFGLAMVQFRKLDAERNGQLTHKEFKEVLDTFHLGLTPAQLTEVIRTCDPEQTQMIDYGHFCKLFASEQAALQMHKVKKKKKKTLKKAPQSIPTDQAKGKAAEKLIPEIVCIVGFLICPVWCLGWIWINSKWPASRWRARFSVSMSVLAGIVGLILIVVLYVLPEDSVTYAQQCPQLTGTLFALRFTGNNARVARFSDYDSQFRLKVAFYKLFEESVGDRSRSVEDAIILDEMIDLEEEEDFTTPRMQLIGRMIATDIDAATELGDQMVGWVNTGLLQQSLLDEGVPFQLVELDFVTTGLAGAPLAIETPVTFEQSKLNVIAPPDPDRQPGVWSAIDSTPFLMRNSPQTVSILDESNAEFQKHLNPALQTCWHTLVYPLPADQCLTNASTPCNTLAADGVTERQDRVLQIEVLTYTTQDILSVWIRQNDGELGVVTEAPMPNWLSDSESAIEAEAVRDADSELCGVDGNIESCPYKYVVNIAKGPFQSFYWIGVVGKIPEAKYVPYQVRSRHDVFNPFRDPVNPFDIFVLEDTVAAASVLLPAYSLAVPIIFALGGTVCQHLL